ncbi:MAG: M48 family metallopeptidase, partial [Acidobacteriaceae bacterium]
ITVAGVALFLLADAATGFGLARKTQATPSNPSNQSEQSGQCQTGNPSSLSAAPAPETSDCVMPGVKRGSINDVNAVGHRNIGGRGFGNWYSEKTEIAWGAQIAQQVLKSSKIVHDPVVDEYVNRIGQNIVKNSDAKVPFTIKVIDSDEINAFALPGGYFFVNSGLILAADNEAELAGVMAHEIAHVAAHHQAREMTRMHYADLGMVPLVMMTGYSAVGYGVYEASAFAVPLTFLEFQRDFEEQADWLGVEYMYDAGYDPQQMIAFFEKIEGLQKTKPGIVSKTFSTHPQTPSRVERTQHEIATILPPRSDYVVDTSEFHAVQQRLRRLENRRPVSSGAGKNAPVLRRIATGSGEGVPSQDSDDGPVLHDGPSH